MAKIELPDKVFGKEVKGAMERVLSSQQTAPDIQPISITPDLNGFVYVPSLKLYIQKQKQLDGKNWNDAHEELIKQGLKMPTIEEFRQFLNYLKQNPNKENTDIYDKITQVRSPWRSEWLDASFKKEGKDMFIVYHIFQGNSIAEKKEKLSDYLAKDKTPGISLEKWLKEANTQGLPKSEIENGNLYYWAPVSGRVARFYADSDRASLYCNRSPDDSYSGLGVRGIKAGDS